MFRKPTSCLARRGVAIVCLAITCSALCKAEEKQPNAEQQPKIDAAADARVRAMSKFYGQLDSFSVSAVHTMEMQQAEDDEQTYSDERRIVVQQPNRIAVTAVGDSEGAVVCDGEQLFAHWPSAERYLLGDAPATLAEVLRSEAAMMMGAGRTAVQLAGGDSYEQFMTGVRKLALLTPEQVEKVTCDRLEMTQESAKITLWIEQGERPLLHKMRWEIEVDLPDADFQMPSQVVTYSDWKIDQPIDEATFAIEVPEDAELVDTFRIADPSADGPHPLVGAEAPDCELTLLKGGSQKLAELEGEKVVVLDFWAQWCAPCVEALPSVDKVATKFADRDIAFFAVNLGDEPDSVREFAEKQELKLPIAVDAKSELATLFDANSIPMTAIIDKQGTVQVVHIGFGGNLEKTLSEDIEAVLAGKQLAEETLQAAREAKRWGKPIPAGEAAVTAEDAVEYEIDFNMRTAVEAYKKVGSRDDAWDEATIDFLTEAARHFSSAKNCKTRVELVGIAEPLIESGCDDPLVTYVLGAMLDDLRQDEASRARGLRFVERAYEGLVERDYPASRRFAAANRIWRSVKKDRNQTEKADKFRALAKQHALQAVLQDNLDTHDGRTLYDHVNGFATSLSLDERGEFCAALKKHAEASPFVVNMVVGEYHIDAAWKARGTSFAGDVTEEGWKGFGEHIELSRDAFEKAWEAAPDRPEAATAMIKVAMGSSSSARNEMRKWFDRAITAQLDYLTAYSNLMYGLLPRWHGSHELIYEFGVECMETERYDTNVPYEFCDAVWRIMRDNQGSLGNRYAKKPGLYEKTSIVCQRYIERPDGEANILWWKTVWLCFAYLSDHWDDAARLLEELDADLDEDALGRFPLSANEVVSAVRLNTSPHAEKILAAFRDADLGDLQQAVEELTKLLAEEDLNSFVATQVKSRVQALLWTLDFEKGEPVSLVPKANLHGWKVVGGSWTQTPSGDLRGVSDKSGVILQCESELGTHWEISGEVSHGKSPYNAWDAGILFLSNGRPEFSMMFNPTQSWVAAGPHRRLKRNRESFEADGNTTQFVVRVEGDTMNVWLNDELVIEDKEIDGLSYATTTGLAIGAKYTWNGSTLTYRNLKLSQIDPTE